MKVSIITVCFNSAKTIEQTIQSVINQTHSNIEYIIIDGGSTDGTVDIIKKYQKNIAYWVSEPDYGLYDAMNKGITKASGEIIGIVNSDDWYELPTVEKVVHCFKTTDAELVHGNRREIDEQSNIAYIHSPNLEKNSIYYKLASLHPTVFVKKDIYQRYGIFDCRYKIAADIDLMLRFYDKGVKFHYIADVLTNFRIGGLSGDRSWRGLKESYHIFCKTLKVTQRVDADEYLAKVNYFFHKKRKSNVGEFVDRRMLRKENLQRTKKYLHSIIKDNCIIFGVGHCGISFYRWCFKRQMKIILFVDNSVRRQQEKIGALEIKAPSVLQQMKNIIIIIAADKANHAMEQQLIEMGFVYQRDYFFYTDVMNSLRQRYMKDKLFFCSFNKHE